MAPIGEISDASALENFVMCVHDELGRLTRRVDQLERENSSLREVADSVTVFETMINCDSKLHDSVSMFYMSFFTTTASESTDREILAGAVTE